MSLLPFRHAASPDSGPARLLLFWDFDAQWGAERSRLPGGAKDWGKLEFSCTDQLLELHARFEIPACFAVVGSVALPGAEPYHAPGQVRRVYAAGHEIASHSHRHEWLPGLGRSALFETLRASKAALEDCIGQPVRAFVPPYNQPFDHVPAGSISLAERREARSDRTTLGRLCDALGETGYSFCRVAYRPFAQRLREWAAGRRIDRSSPPETIGTVTCVRLNTPGGFDGVVMRRLDQAVQRREWIVVYGHPHSLHAGNSQDEKHLVPFLQRVRELREAAQLQVLLPRQLERVACGV